MPVNPESLSPPREDTARRRPTASQEEGPRRNVATLPPCPLEPRLLARRAAGEEGPLLPEPPSPRRCATAPAPTNTASLFAFILIKNMILPVKESHRHLQTDCEPGPWGSGDPSWYHILKSKQEWSTARMGCFLKDQHRDKTMEPSRTYQPAARTGGVYLRDSYPLLRISVGHALHAAYVWAEEYFRGKLSVCLGGHATPREGSAFSVHLKAQYRLSHQAD